MEAREDFQARTEEFLDDRLGRSWRRAWTFDSLVRQVNDVMDIDPARHGHMITATTGSLLDIIERERSRMRRIDDFNRKRKQNADT